MKNIILVITDTFRYDNLKEKAQRPVHTPYLNRFLTERATAVSGCYTASFPTIPHRTDTATGVLGWPHYGWQPIDLSNPNHIAEMLRDSGYESQLICDCPHLFRTRFQDKFSAALQIRGQEGDRPFLYLNDPIQTVVPDEKTRTSPRYRGATLANTHRWTNRYYTSELETFPARTGQTTIRWLEENHRFHPFFLWVDFFDPHEPWDPPEYLVKRYDAEYDGIPMLHPNYGPASAFFQAELKNLWAHYAAEAELVDRWIGRIIEKITDLDLWEESIVLITSDHGMSIGEHERTGKSNIHEQDPRYWPIYPEIGHVPCLLAGSDIPRGYESHILVQPTDFLPTLCEIAEVRPSPTQAFDGTSFARQLIQGGTSHREFTVSGSFIEGGADGEPPQRRPTPFLVTKEWGYTPVGAYGKPELYRMPTDPLAFHNIAAGNDAVVKELNDLFISHLSRHRVRKEDIEFWKSAGAGEGRWAIDYTDS